MIPIPVELIISILPLVISALEHQKKASKLRRNLTSDKSKNEQQLDFFYELYDELALLENTLNWVVSGLPSRSDSTGLWPLTPNDRQELDKVLGDNAEPFRSNLERLLKSLDALVSDRSLNLANPDPSVVSYCSPP